MTFSEEFFLVKPKGVIIKGPVYFKFFEKKINIVEFCDNLIRIKSPHTLKEFEIRFRVYIEWVVSEQKLV